MSKRDHQKELDFPDIFHLLAAEGWVELGNSTEAHTELKKISPEFRPHPEVLNLRWIICAKERNWKASLKIASALIKKCPEASRSWLQYSISLHQLKRTDEAYLNLLQGITKFPNDWLICYDLACYCAQMGRLNEAWEWLAQACRAGTTKQVKVFAVNDPDLEPIWEEMGLPKASQAATFKGH